MASWEDLSRELGKITNSTKAVAHEVVAAAAAAGHDVWHLWGWGPNPEHNSELAIDFMVRTEAAGDFVRNYLWENRKRLGLRHVIWEQHITSVAVQPGVRRLMADRGNPTANHYDHVHMLRYNVAYVSNGGTGGGSSSGKLAVDGKLGPQTIKQWQTVMGTPVDGVIDVRDSELVKAVQRHLNTKNNAGLTVDGVGIRQDGNAYKTVLALQKYLGTPRDGRMSVPVSEVVKAVQRRLNEGWF